MKTKRICIISGATATGKTDLAIGLASKYNGEIINFDSLLFYKELNIGTAKPTLSERALVTHHLIDISSVAHPINAHDFMLKALPIIENIHSRGKIPFLVGGSGFYLQAVLYGMFDSSTTPSSIIEKSNKLYEQVGIKPFIEILKQHDHKSYELYHANDHYRIRRAVEHFWHHETPFSHSRIEKLKNRHQFSHINKYKWNVHHIYLEIPKDEHLNIIARRAKHMLDTGLLEEVKKILSSGATGTERPLKSIGYKEVIRYLHGDYTFDEMLQRINISTWQLAKSQKTWFKKIEKFTYHTIKDRIKLDSDLDLFFSKKD